MNISMYIGIYTLVLYMEIVVWLADLSLEIIEIKVHLSDVIMLNFRTFQVNQYVHVSSMSNLELVL